MPLATDLRPKSLSEYIGQDKLLGEHGVIRKMIESDQISSMVLWGPPASGKTTLASIIANETGARFEQLSAVMDGKAKLKKILEQARINPLQKTILFIDEIHRWNKSQQDALLPHVESGLITLIGATTENPSFTIISALLSRARVYVLEPHSADNIIEGLKRAKKKLGAKIDAKTIQYLAELSNGDIRFGINSLEVAHQLSDGKKITIKTIENSVNKYLRYDRDGDEHYNIISAVHKSLRSSNPTAATYWTCRMLDAGEDPLYIARRLLRFASEDIGNANPTALLIANNVYDACHKLGMPECGVHIVQLCEYLARSPKSNKAYTAYSKAMSDIKQHGNLPVPIHLRNAPTKLMRDLDYGKGYEYDHDLVSGKSDQQLLPDELDGVDYY